MRRVGIDIGGTQLRAAVFDEENRMVDSMKRSNDRSLTARENMDRLLDFLQARSDSYSGVGIGCPGPLDIKQGKILTPPNLVGWDNFHIVDYVEQRLGVPARLNNDANVAGLAEAVLGAGAGYESVAFVGVSTGIGGAYIYRGQLVNGAHSNAAEFWNMIVNEDGHCHKNANPGSLNEQSSGSGLTRFAQEAYGPGVDARALFARFYQGEERAIQIVERAADTLAKGIANITCIIDPDVIILGGSVAIHNPDYVRLTAERARRYMIAPDSLQIELAKFGDDAGLIGASLLIEKK